MAFQDSTEIVLIDLSSIAYPIYLTTQADPDPNKASQEIAARIRSLTNGHPHVAICCDGGRSFRHDLSKTYKANRPEKDAALHHQIALAREALQMDGFPVWVVPGFEADDLIATATARALALPDLTVLVVSQDKDLLQLVGPRVRAKSSRDGAIVDEAGVVARFGVRPAQMRDYLALVGDAADNIKGAASIGPKKAAALLATFESIDGFYEALDSGTAAVAPAILTAMKDFRQQMDATRALVTLRTDVDIPFDEIAAERVQKDGDLTPVEDDDRAEPEADAPSAAPIQSAASEAPAASSHSIEQGSPAVPEPSTGPVDPGTGLATIRAVDAVPVPAEYERQLDPRSMREAQVLAENMHKSRMFSSYGSAPAVLSTIMVGRELGLPAMASLRAIHNIEGRHSLSASLMVALVLKSGLAEYFEPISFSPTEATFKTKRKGARNPVKLTHTIEMARQAWPKGKSADPRKANDWEAAFLASGWGRNPTDMLVARATSRLARMIYPDLLAGLYTPEELEEIRQAERGAA